MTTLGTTAPDSTAAAAAPLGFVRRGLRHRILHKLAGLRSGAVCLRENGHVHFLGDPTGPLGTLHLDVHDSAFWPAVALGGALGAGEGYAAGHWQVDDPVRLVRLLLRDAEVLGRLDGGSGRLAQLGARLLHALRPNTRQGARANIAAHYDLGNDFFAAWLDPSMTYSSAFFTRPDLSLEQAQQAKLERLLHLVQLQPGDSLLEIGTGWGSMAICAASRFGARVTTTTISARQREVAAQRIADAGLAERVELLAQDYRDLRGTYDKLVSVEMVEAVGARFLPGFFRACSERLARGGLFAMQAITIEDHRYARALRQVDFIKKHIFPGSFIPSPTALLTAATAGSDLRLVAFEDFGAHYATTLGLWRNNLRASWSSLREAGYADSLLRTYDWYLAYCEGGFAERKLGVAHLLFTH